MSELRDSIPPVHLRLFTPDHPSQVESDGPRLSDRMTLSQFFECWFLPVVLVQHATKPQSIKPYRDALRYWKLITHDPPLRLIDEYVVAMFLDGLRSATWSRSKLRGSDRLLSEATQAKHLRYIRAILYRTGPSINPKRPGKGLIAAAPYVYVPPVDGEPKPPYSLDQVRRMMAATAQMERPDIAGITPGAWWQATLCLLFYTGQRYATIINPRLVWDKIEQRADGWWLKLDRDDVPKTSKAQNIALHHDAVTAISRIQSQRKRIIPFPHCKTAFDDWHTELQELAGIPAAEQMSVQAWRRTHGCELAELGLKKAEELARSSLNHANVKTTRRSYVNVEAKFIRQLPSILPAAGDDARQRKLF